MEREATWGTATIRLAGEADGFVGTVAVGGEVRHRDEGADAGLLWRGLHEAAARLRGEFLGFDGVRARFLEMYPEGFQSRAYVERERLPVVKLKAQVDLRCALGEVRQTFGFASAVNDAFRATSLVPSFERARVAELLSGPHADAFIHAAARFTDGVAQGFAEMAELLGEYEAAKWPVATFLPFMWRPEGHALLRPAPTLDFAARVGHPFRTDYTPRLDLETYRSFGFLLAETTAELAPLAPRDRFDVLNFMWLTGAMKPEQREPAAAGAGAG